MEEPAAVTQSLVENYQGDKEGLEIRGEGLTIKRHEPLAYLDFREGIPSRSERQRKRDFDDPNTSCKTYLSVRDLTPKALLANMLKGYIMAKMQTN